MFLVKLDPAANHVFSKSFAFQTSLYAWVSDVAVTSKNEVVVAGRFDGAFDLGGGNLLPGSPYIRNTFVGRFDAAGQHAWSAAYSTSYNGVYRMRLGPDDAIVLAGNYANGVSFGGAPLPSPATLDPFVVKLAADGNHVWSRGFVDGTYAYIHGLAVDGMGRAVFGGEAVEFDFGHGKGVGTHGFLVGLDATGGSRWQYPDLKKVVRSLAFDAQGHLYAAGLDFLWKLTP
jgi:hypothetical protein